MPPPLPEEIEAMAQLFCLKRRSDSPCPDLCQWCLIEARHELAELAEIEGASTS
jgi:hypothetical protein